MFNRVLIFLVLFLGYSATAVADKTDSYPQVTAGSNTVAESKQDTVSAEKEVNTKIAEKIQKNKIAWEITFDKIIWTIIILIITMIAIKYISKILAAIGERFSNLRLLIKGLIPIVRISTWTFVIYFIIATIISPPIETLIAVTASAGIAVGFASQDILKNIFGGIMILFDRPFQVGDKIQVGSHYGEVIQIGLRTVRIVTADDSAVSIPNGEIVNQSVSNSNSGEFNCQVSAVFFLPAHIDMVKLKMIAFRAAAVSRYVYLKKPIKIVIINENFEGRSILKVKLKAYVFDLRYEFDFASEMTELVIQQLLKEKLVSPEELSLGLPA